MTRSCMSLLKHVRLLNGCNATWVGWTKGVSTGQQKYHSDGAYRKAVILSNNARTQLKREDLEYRAHEAAPQCKRRQEAKASSK